MVDGVRKRDGGGFYKFQVNSVLFLVSRVTCAKFCQTQIKTVDLYKKYLKIEILN